MGRSADPKALTPSESPSPANPSPPSADGKRLRRSVQSKLSWGLVKPAGGGEGGGGGAGASARGGEAEAVPPASAAEAEKEVKEEPEKGKKKRKPRKSEGGGKQYGHTVRNSMSECLSHWIIDESPQKKQRKGRKQDAALKVPNANRKRCKALESPDGYAKDNIDVLTNQDKSPIKVDLRSEAKMAAEINLEDHLLVSSANCQTSLLDPHGRPEVPQNGFQPGYYLWTDKYRPETAAQVCGNSEHVKFLSDWLKGWDERGHKTGAATRDTNDSSHQDESDTDYSDDTSDGDNVLLITGPVGCGKSAAVFACAREQGFNVIEVNTSDMRNGAYVRQKFEEATKSHGLEKWSQEEAINPLLDDSLDPDSGTPDRTEYQQLMSCAATKRVVIDVDQHKSPVGYYSGSKVSDEAPKQVVNKTLILFEDVDTIFDEDRGFISTILKMAETTKWPIILTSNRKYPSLPNLLDQLALNFKYPSTSELLSHVTTICKSERLDITVPQLKHVVDVCLGDIRRTMMLLQFWYQGKQQFPDIPLPSDQQPKRNRHGSLLLSESDDDPVDVHTEKHDIFPVTEVGLFPQPSEDMLHPSSTPCAEPDDFSWYSNQVEMGSVYAQHALCIFSRKSHDIGGGSVDLSRELLFASTAAVSLGKTISSGLTKDCGSLNVAHMKNPTTSISIRR
nr:unnamed protein product [Digitaria exilis]